MVPGTQDPSQTCFLFHPLHQSPIHQPQFLLSASFLLCPRVPLFCLFLEDPSIPLTPPSWTHEHTHTYTHTYMPSPKHRHRQLGSTQTSTHLTPYCWAYGCPGEPEGFLDEGSSWLAVLPQRHQLCPVCVLGGASMRTSYPQVCVQGLPNPDLQKVCLLPNVQYDF